MNPRLEVMIGSNHLILFPPGLQVCVVAQMQSCAELSEPK